MDNKVALLEQKVDKLVDSNLTMADQITKLLKEKTALEEALKEKDISIDLSRKQVLSIAKQNKPQEQEIKDLKDQFAKLKEEKAAADREIADLNLKLSELKKKLARMVELVNKYMRTYE
jgi:chromosome segregation ATPase